MDILTTVIIKASAGRKRQVFNLNGARIQHDFIALVWKGFHRFALCILLGDIRYRWEQDLRIGATRSERCARGLAKSWRITMSANFPECSPSASAPRVVGRGRRVTAVHSDGTSSLAAALRRAVTWLSSEYAPEQYLAERWFGARAKSTRLPFRGSGRGALDWGVRRERRPIEGWDMAGESVTGLSIRTPR